MTDSYFEEIDSSAWPSHEVPNPPVHVGVVMKKKERGFLRRPDITYIATITNTDLLGQLKEEVEVLEEEEETSRSLKIESSNPFELGTKIRNKLGGDESIRITFGPDGKDKSAFERAREGSEGRVTPTEQEIYRGFYSEQES